MKPNRGDIGGEITVSLIVARGRVSAAHIASSRTANTARMFIGRSPEEVLALIGSIYSLCGTAQTVAGLLAVEAAAGLAVSPVQQAARNVLRLSEMLSQNAMRIFLHWPKLLGLKDRPELVRLCFEFERVLERSVMGGRNWKIPGGVNLKPTKTEVETALGHIDAALAEALQMGGFVDKLRRVLHDRNLEGFGALPVWCDVEEGALSRHWDREEVVEVRNKSGTGLAARLEAGICDLAELPEKIGEFLDSITADMPPDCPGTNDGRGTVRVETARGWLQHKVFLKNGRFADYQIDAPTEVNFRGGGPVVAGLIGADASNESNLINATRLHIMAIDPCVGFQVEVIHA